MPEKISIHEIGLVIQGPIQSTGRVLTDLSQRKYDATNDVSRMLEVAEKMGLRSTVVTWQNQDTSKFASKHSNLIQKIEYPPASIFTAFKNDWNNNSKYRQYYSTLLGVSKLKHQGCNYVIKVRTDNYTELTYLIAYLQTLSVQEASKYFYVPLINIDKPHMFYDFYGFAATETFYDFCQAILYEKEITTNIHFDVFYRWTKRIAHQKRSTKDFRIFYPKYPFFTRDQLDFIRYGLDQAFRPLPVKVWTNLTWRGEKFGEKGIKDQYRFSETSPEKILKDFDAYPFKITRKLNINFPSTPSYFFTSRIEVHLVNLNSKLKGLVRRILNLLRKILNR